MKNNKINLYPPFLNRIYSVWYRHYKVYTKNIISNGLPPFLEPLIFLAGMGLGLNTYITNMDGVPYLEFLAAGLLLTSAMFTAAFECSYGTFIRMEFDKVYDAMLAAPITLKDLLVGEILWAGTKGFFFSLAVLFVISTFGIVPLNLILLAPFVGFITGVMFAALSLLITSFVSDINQFNFYFTGFLSPMFFFSGVVFPLEKLPSAIRPFAEIFPLTHSIRLVRALCSARFQWHLFLDLGFIIVFTAIVGYFGIKRLGKRLIS